LEGERRKPVTSQSSPPLPFPEQDEDTHRDAHAQHEHAQGYNELHPRGSNEVVPRKPRALIRTTSILSVRFFTINLQYDRVRHPGMEDRAGA